MPRKRREKEKAWHRTQVFAIPIEPFNSCVTIGVNMDERQFARALRKTMHKKTVKRVMKAIGDWNASVRCGTCARTTFVSGVGFFVLIKAHPDYFRSMVGSLVHELTHVAQILLRDRGVPATQDTDEVQAYLMGHLVTEALKRMY